MSSTKREREYARRRYQDWQARQAEHGRRSRRRRRAAAGLVAALTAVGVLVALVLAFRPDPPPPAAATQVPGPAASPAWSPPPSRDAPDPALAENRTWTGTLQTSRGAIGVELDGTRAPQSVAGFITLAREGFYEDTPCHRLTVEGIHVLQCGDPSATGTGGPGYTFGPVENAPAGDVYPAGTIAMARRGGDAGSQGSQFFLVYRDSMIPSDAAGGYSVFGKVTSGLDIVQQVADGGVDASGVAPALPIAIEKVEVK